LGIRNGLAQAGPFCCVPAFCTDGCDILRSFPRRQESIGHERKRTSWCSVPASAGTSGVRDERPDSNLKQPRRIGLTMRVASQRGGEGGRRADRRRAVPNAVTHRRQVYAVCANDLLRHSRLSAHRPAAFSVRRRAALCLHAPEAAHGVSQLLAGVPSDPGRSPGAARVRGCEPRPQAPRPAPPSRTPPDGAPQ